MKTIILAGKTVKHYDSISDLPYDRFIRFNAMLMIDSAASPDGESISNKLIKFKALVAEGKFHESVIQANNINQAFDFAVTNVSPKMLAFAALVVKVNDSTRDDLSDNGLTETSKLYQKEKNSILTALFDAVKKKIYTEVKALKSGIDGESLMFYEIVKSYISQIKDSIVLGKPETIDYETKLIAFGSPTILHGKDGVETQADSEHALLKLIFSRDYNLDIDKTPVLQVMNIIKIIETQKKPTPQ